MRSSTTLHRPHLRVAASLLAGAILAVACAPAVNPPDPRLQEHELASPSPEEWRQRSASFPGCPTSRHLPPPGASTTLPDVGVTLALPPGASSVVGMEPPTSRMWILPDTAVLGVERNRMQGWPNYAVQVEGAVSSTESTCRQRIGEHAAVVRRLRLTSPDTSYFAGVVELVPGAHDYLAGVAIAPTASRRDTLLAVLTGMQVLPRWSGRPTR